MATGCSYQYEYVPRMGQLCGQPGWRDELCIGHHPGPKDEAAFRQAVEAKVAAEDWDFQEWVFPWDADFSGKELKEADFIGATFQGEASFGDATFQGEARFWFATFQGVARFWGATFQGEADFGYATFQGEADFGYATFQGEAGFGGATFTNGARFEGTRFQGDLVLDTTKFERTASFGPFASPRRFRSISETSENLEQVGNEGWVRLDFPYLWGLWRMHVECVLPDVAARLTKKSQQYLVAETLYRNLRNSCESNRDHIRANRFFYLELEMLRHRLGGWEWLLLSLYHLLSGYGTRWRRALFWYGAVLLLFTLGYAAVGYQLETPGASPGPVTIAWRSLPWFSQEVTWDAVGAGTVRLFLHSFRTTLLQREPELRPLLWTGFLFEGLETALGPILLFLLGLCVRRRFQR